MPQFKVGVIGTGYWGKKIVDEFSNIQNVSIEAVSDLSEDNLKFCSDRFGIKRTFKDYHELLAISEINAVAIATPNITHYEICKVALESGKHVLVEKPITLDSKKGWELVKIAEEKNLTLSVGHIFRFNNALAELKRLMGQRFLGKIFLMDFVWTNQERLFTDRDVIIDLAPHMFDMMNYLLDTWPSEIVTVAASHRNNVYETAQIHAKFDDGPLANVYISWVIPKKTRQLSIVGDSRSMFVNAVAQDISVFESGYTYQLGIERNNTIRDELLHFIESIGNPMAETKNSGAVGVKTIEMIEAANKSLREKKAIRIDNSDK